MSKARNPESQMLFYFMYLGIKLFLSSHSPVHWLFFKGNEFWKDVKGYEGLYAVSSKGRLKSFHINKNGKVLSLYVNKKGYLIGYLCYPNSKNKKFGTGIHRLVMLNFKTNPENKPEVNHKNGKKYNNCLYNLEWSTNKENINHAIKTGLRTVNINLKNNSLFTSSDLVNIRQMIKSGSDNQEICKLYNCQHSTISKIRRGHHYSNPEHPPEDIWDTLSVKNKIIFDTSTGVFYENIKIAARSKNINHQVLRYQLLYAVKNITTFIFI